jgi:hypothetical protein
MLGMLGFVQLLPERLGGAEVDACDKKEWIPLRRHLESQGRRSLADAYGPWAMAQTWMQGCMPIRLRYISQHTTDTGNSSRIETVRFVPSWDCYSKMVQTHPRLTTTAMPYQLSPR